MRILIISLLLGFIASPVIADSSEEKVTKTIQELEQVIQEQKSYEQLKRETLTNDEETKNRLEQRSMEQLQRKYEGSSQQLNIPQTN